MTRLAQAKLPVHYKQLLNNLLQFNPYMRWSARECVEMEVFQSVDPWKHYLSEATETSQKPEKIYLDIDEMGSGYERDKDYD